MFMDRTRNTKPKRIEVVRNGVKNARTNFIYGYCVCPYNNSAATATISSSWTQTATERKKKQIQKPNAKAVCIIDGNRIEFSLVWWNTLTGCCSMFIPSSNFRRFFAHHMKIVCSLLIPSSCTWCFWAANVIHHIQKIPEFVFFHIHVCVCVWE